jgi:hypothetical protein
MLGAALDNHRNAVFCHLGLYRKSMCVPRARGGLGARSSGSISTHTKKGVEFHNLSKHLAGAARVARNGRATA